MKLLVATTLFVFSGQVSISPVVALSLGGMLTNLATAIERGAIFIFLVGVAWAVYVLFRR